jgi:CheY-like chemotaxis protein
MHEPPRVLIVDDDPDVILTFARMLRLEGFMVTTAMTAETALRQVTETHPDAVLVDLCMPLMDGLGFLRQLRALEGQRATPVAIVTGNYFISDSVSQELLDLNASLHFKPLWLDDLLRITRHLVAS